MDSLKVAVITGAGRGIGREVARQLAGAGFSVVVVARTEAEIGALAEELVRAGHRALAVPADVSRVKEIEGLFGRVKGEFGRVDVLINNAGIGSAAEVEGTDEDLWDRTMDTNLKGAFFAIREALPLFDAAGGGVVVNVASMAALRGFPAFSCYSASKAGLLGLTRSLREELRPRKVRVAAVSPGATNSSIWDEMEGEWDRSRMMTCEAVAATIVHVATQAEGVLVEDVVLMPSGGAL